MKKYLNRDVKQLQIFKVSGTFNSMYAAQEWLHKNGYTYGSTSVNAPVPIVKGDKYNLPQKWHNLTKYGKSIVDGVMISDDFRDGEVKTILFN